MIMIMLIFVITLLYYYECIFIIYQRHLHLFGGIKFYEIDLDNGYMMGLGFLLHKFQVSAQGWQIANLTPPRRVRASR